MSLINDALKRAKQHQPPSPGEGGGGAPMRPIDPHPRSGSGASPLIIGLIVLVLLGAGVLFYLAGRNSNPPAGTAGLAAATSAPAVSIPAHPPTAPMATPATNPTPAQPIAAVTNAPETPVIAPTPPPVVVTQVVVVATNPPVAVIPALKLQGIFYRPTRPSAMINGKTVEVGDKVGDARVLAITQTTVLVLQGGKTNQLSLE